MKSTCCAAFAAVSILWLSSCFLPHTDVAGDAREYVTRTGKIILVKETHPGGQSISTIQITTEGFVYEFLETYEEMDPISNVMLADLNQDSFDEIYIVTAAQGSGSYGNILAFASNRDRSLSMINFPEINDNDKYFSGYMGHDSFAIKGNSLVRTFPVYKDDDTNARPTGGTRTITYGLFPGEAMWQLRIESVKFLK